MKEAFSSHLHVIKSSVLEMSALVIKERQISSHPTEDA